MIAVLAPVWRRPENAKPLVRSLLDSTEVPWRLVFICSPQDTAELRACAALARRHPEVFVEVMRHPPGPGDYCRKINLGVRVTREPWLFQGADDLRFTPGWAEAALAVAERTGCRVIGTNDLCNRRVIRGQHSTHSLVARSYVEEVGTVDEPGKLLHEGYHHNFCDDELVTAARLRREFAPARDAVVEHLHPHCGKSENDPVYVAGLKDWRLDRRHFQLRRRVFARRGA